MDARSGDVNSIVIVGGGASGWLSAAFLQRFLNSDPDRVAPVRIRVVEAPNIPIIGVGEATVPPLKGTMEYLGIPELALLKETHGTFKQAIRYEGWGRPEDPQDYFYHPFDYGVQQVYEWLGHTWLERHHGAKPFEFGRELSIQCRLCDHARAPWEPTRRGDMHDERYAYHLDAVLLAGLLRRTAMERGVEHVVGKVSDVALAESGNIAAVVLEDGRRVEGDLFVDCSGFHGLLLTHALREDFLSFAPDLMCDRAFALQLKEDPTQPIAPYTRATAMKGGWAWSIQLQHRHGAGYVFSSNHLSDQQAMDELLQAVGEDKVLESFTPRVLRMRTGRHRRAWVRNCVAIGLAGGFIEPLESTGIYLSELGVRTLTECWPTAANREVMAVEYNRRVAEFYAELLDFIVFHYRLARRRDTDFWHDAAENGRISERLGRNLELWKYRAPLPPDAGTSGKLFSHLSYQYILAGMRPDVGQGYRPIGLYRRPDEELILKAVWSKG
ncbi:MAG TPA: tryptophan halogenase family protein, partial [Gammaproteobacteria bacterium]|nr:tryptophan halogenase family protein [Gammaproteobacteria bacterium]